METTQVNNQGADLRYSDSDRLECKICWYVYDPASGDEEGQIPAGTPFRLLPSHWSCPQCDADKTQFLVVGY